MTSKRELDTIHEIIASGVLPDTGALRLFYGVQDCKRQLIAHLAAKYEKSEAFIVDTFTLEFVGVDKTGNEAIITVNNSFNRYHIGFDRKWKIGEKVSS